MFIFIGWKEEEKELEIPWTNVQPEKYGSNCSK